ncbi:MurR/RpiR family transcriptional regulator [Erysipelothrix sp. HDW6C]|uniref:MurR/RpiR family transcriptional regulator n=1 Tax=Erysipelothrix sp. HDW6C TaxID=2714930 RepID=UPI00140AF658|nr:MurR/RpiR family transcriptional regulator [Erysipelothrix sp. HDW6C]QIK70550.1 MurR/RpiR family transcriptional regulator [Erysipelothrix sp. HDW6C]
MLLFNRIKNLSTLSDTEQKISHYILEHANSVTTMSIQELAEKTYTSPATITRYCRKMDTEGFSDFKVQLAKELNAHHGIEGRIRDDLPFKKNQTTTEIIDSILNLSYQSMQDTYNSLNFQQLNQIARMIYEAPHLYLYGSGQSLILCEDFQYKLFRIEKDCNFESNVGFQFMKTHTQPEDSIALVISYYGTGINNLRIMASLKERNIPIILITGPNTNPLCDYATEVVHVAPQEELITKMASFSSRTAIQLVLDFIYALVFSFEYEDNQERIESSTLLP